MKKSDLKQIKKVIDDSVDNAINTSVKKIVDESVDNAINTSVKKIVDESVDNLAKITSNHFVELETKMDQRFNQVDKRLDNIDLELKKKLSKEDLEDWMFDNKIKTDINALKYVNIDKLRNIPSASVIKKTLVKEGLE